MEINQTFSMYRLMNPDIKGNVRQMWTHWCSFGRYETRYIYFDLKTYLSKESIEDDGDVENQIIVFGQNPLAAKKYCKQIVYSDDSNLNIISLYKEFMFDVDFYTQTHNVITENKMNYYEAYLHYMNVGEINGFSITDFVLIDYLFLNPALIGRGITTSEEAVRHWINCGKREKLKYKL